jgi:hypothetical protein
VFIYPIFLHCTIILDFSLFYSLSIVLYLIDLYIFISQFIHIYLFIWLICVYIIHSFVHLFIHSFIQSFIHSIGVQNVTIPCRSQELLPFLSVIYLFLPLFSTNYSSILLHFILPSISSSACWSCWFQIHIQYSFGNSIFFHSLHMPKPCVYYILIYFEFITLWLFVVYLLYFALLL